MGQLLWSLFTTSWPQAAMRGHIMALSGLWAALLMMVVIGVVQGQDYGGTMQCQCECASDCTSGDPVTCDCPEPAFACAPGFTQVCPLTAGACPAGMSPKCPGGGAPPTTTTTTTTTPAPPALVTEQFDIGLVKCGKVKYQCKMTATFMDDCSSVTKVVPSCSPKKSKCTKGVNVNFDASNGCSISGKYKNTGKKQSFSGLSIDGFVTAAPTTIPPTTTAGPTAAPGETQGCQCMPDFLIYWLQAVPASHSADYTCACLPDAAML